MTNNCCADLEERIAELEATTARKGNRKVSLTVSGWVGEQVMWWDDGREQNVYVTGLGTTLATHVKFTGQATISPGWTAGYVPAPGSDRQRSAAGQQPGRTSGHRGFSPQYRECPAVVLVREERKPRARSASGKQSQASDNTAILVDGSGSLVPANWVVFEGAGFFLRENGDHGGNFVPGGAWKCHLHDIIDRRHGGVAGDCNGNILMAVRYDYT